MFQLLKKALKNPKVRTGIQLFFTIVVLLLIFNSIEISNLTQFLSSINIRLFLYSLVLTIIMRCLWAIQISLTQAPMDMHFSVYNIFRIQMIATFYSLVLPGDLVAGGVSWYKLSQPDSKYIEAGALLIFFRLVQISNLIFVGLFAAWMDQQIAAPEIRTIIVIGLFGIILMWVIFFSNQISKILTFITNKLNGKFSFLTSPLTSVEKIFDSILKFRSLSKNRLIIVFSVSIIAQVIGLVYYLSLARAVNIQLSIFVIGWISTLVTIVQMIPVSIAGLGVREISYAVLLSDYGISPEQAISFSITIFAVFIFVGLLGGVYELSDIYKSWQTRSKSSADPGKNITEKTNSVK